MKEFQKDCKISNKIFYCSHQKHKGRGSKVAAAQGIRQ